MTGGGDLPLTLNSRVVITYVSLNCVTNSRFGSQYKIKKRLKNLIRSSISPWLGAPLQRWVGGRVANLLGMHNSNKQSLVTLKRYTYTQTSRLIKDRSVTSREEGDIIR